MAMGCAVVATRTTGQTDVIEDGVTGLYVDPGDVDGWCRALERLTRDPALCESLGANARAWILNHASLALWVRQISSEIAKFGVTSTSWQANCKHFAAGEKV
jgi:glycosyltransferase involved in cell wall biosynthesis